MGKGYGASWKENSYRNYDDPNQEEIKDQRTLDDWEEEDEKK